MFVQAAKQNFAQWEQQKLVYVLDGKQLSVADVARISENKFTEVHPSAESLERMKLSWEYLNSEIDKGRQIYCVNTGPGNSVSQTSNDIRELQSGVLRHMHVGFGKTFDSRISRAVMAVRANSMCLGYAAVSPEIVKLLCTMINADIIPEIPLRGSISASGDLLPLGYLALCMSGEHEINVVVDNGQKMSNYDAFKSKGLSFVTFNGKDVLGVVNSTAVSSAVSSIVCFDSIPAVLLTLVSSALSTECLHGNMDSFHESVVKCLPHKGNVEVAHIMNAMLKDSQLVRNKSEFPYEKFDQLFQDRYPIRTAVQWLGPVTETLLESLRRLTVELQSSSTNPIVDHEQRNIITCGNFQGTAITLATDQLRQALQLCARIIYAQHTELVNNKMTPWFPPNLSGSDYCTDFGYQMASIMMTSLMSEVDSLTGQITNYVQSAEQHNQSINSLALISARRTEEVLELLQMMLSINLLIQMQGIDLRWLKRHTEKAISEFLSKNQMEDLSDTMYKFPWYDYLLRSEATITNIKCTSETKNFNGIENLNAQLRDINSIMQSGSAVEQVAQNIGKGTGVIYLYVRKTLGIRFNNGAECAGNNIDKIFKAIRNREIIPTLTTVCELIPPEEENQVA